MSVRVRYAPSPTGDPHLGNLRVALYDYLLAKHEGGTFILRLEDTDQNRLVENSVQRIFQSLQWLGLEPDEGVYLDDANQLAQRGPFGPYIQSERLPIYYEYAEELLANGTAYRCFCTPERLDQMRKDQEAAHQPPRYDQRCRHIDKEESERRAAAGEAYVIRHAIPAGRQIKFKDIVMGEITFQTDDLDDYVLLKSDGFPTYQLANVVDDHLMEITNVLRGNEWIPSAPKNLLLYEAFGWTPPLYAHLPLILGTDKTKLGKRNGAEPVLNYRDKGYLPEAVLNFAVFLGWSPGTEEEIFTKDELVKRFDVSRVQKSPAVFDVDRLNYLNGWYIRQLPLGDVAAQMLPFLESAGLVQKVGDSYASTSEVVLGRESFGEYMLAVAIVLQERIKHFDESALLSWFFFKRPEYTAEVAALMVPKKSSAEAIKPIMEEVGVVLRELPGPWSREKVEEVLRQFIAQKEYKSMEVLWPLRAALTDEPASPGAFEMLEVLGKEEALWRLERALAVL